MVEIVYGMRFPKWFVSAFLAFELIMSLLQLLNAFHVWYFPLSHGWSYTLRFDLGFSLVLVLLPVSSIILVFLTIERRYLEVFLASSISLGFNFVFGLEAAVAVFSLIHVALALLYLVDFRNFLFWFLVLLTVFEAAALFHWVLFPFGIESPFVWFADLELALFYVFATLAPVIVIFTYLIMLIRLLKIRLEITIQFSNTKLISIISKTQMIWRKFIVGKVEPSRRFSARTTLFLVFTLFLSIAAALYPYSPALNPNRLNFGVDIPHYVEDAELVEKDVFLAFEVWGHTRPLIFLTINGFQRLIGSDALTAVRFLPVFLNPLIALSVFFVAYEVFGNSWVGAWAAFFTVCGYQVVVGMYSYFLTNMLGLCLVYSSLAFLFRSIRLGCKRCLVISSLLGGLLAFTHPWTLVHYFVTGVLTAVILLLKVRSKSCHNWSFVAISVYLVSMSVADLLKVLIFHSSGVVSASSLVISGQSGLLNFWDGTISVFRVLYGGFMSNLVLLGLAIVGIYLQGRRNVPDIFFRVFLIITSLVFLVGDETIKSRLMYNIPVGLYSATGLLLFPVRGREKNAFTLFIILNMIVYMFRSLANLF